MLCEAYHYTKSKNLSQHLASMNTSNTILVMHSLCAFPVDHCMVEAESTYVAAFVLTRPLRLFWSVCSPWKKHSARYSTPVYGPATARLAAIFYA